MLRDINEYIIIIIIGDRQLQTPVMLTDRPQTEPKGHSWAKKIR